MRFAALVRYVELTADVIVESQCLQNSINHGKTTCVYAYVLTELNSGMLDNDV